jgi:hypothetical protein
MYLGNTSKKLALFFVAMLLISTAFSQSAEEEEEEANQTISKTSTKPITTTHFGFSYSMWNEDLKISQAGESEIGFANYAGFGLVIDKNWIINRLVYGGSLSFGIGKVSSGGFEELSYPDGVNRSWLAASGNIYGLYRLDSTFMTGISLMGRQLQADWTAEDEALTITPASATQTALQFVLRWSITNQVSLVQTYTPLNFGNSSMWCWTLQSSL